MSNPEQSTSIAADPEAIARALGSEPATYVGTITVEDLITGAVTRKLEVAKRARLLAKTAEPTEAIPDKIGRLAKTIDRTRRVYGFGELTTEQKDLTARCIESLLAIYERTQEGQDHVTTIRELFSLYIRNEQELGVTAPGLILGGAAEEYGIEVDFDPDRIADIYHELYNADLLVRLERGELPT